MSGFMTLLSVRRIHTLTLLLSFVVWKKPTDRFRIGMSRVQDVKQGLQFSHRLYQLKAQHNLSQEDYLTLVEFVDELLPVSCTKPLHCS